MTNTINYFITWLINKLPNSPFQSFIPVIDEIRWLQYMNWFLPIDNLLAITTAWLTIISIYYGYKVAKTALEFVVGLVRTLL